MQLPNARRAGLLLLTVLAVVVAGIGLERSSTRGNDFDNFYDAAVSVWQQGELLREKGTLRYPLTFQVLLSPLGAVPIGAAAFFWLLLNCAGYACLPFALARLSGTPPARQAWAWFAVAPFVVSNITLGQSGPLLLGLSTLGILLAARGRAVLGGAALTTAGLLKVFPGAFLAVPIVLGRARGALAGALLAAAVAAGWASLALGAEQAGFDFVRWIQDLRWEHHADQLIATGRSLRHNNQGLVIALMRSLTTDFSHAPQEASPGSLQILSLPQGVVWALYYAILAALAAVLALASWRVRRAPGPRAFLGLYALAVHAALAISPIVWTHYFLWWLPSFVFLAERKRLLGVIGVASLLAAFTVPARALGFHALLSLATFGIVAHQLLREGAAGFATPPAGEPQ